MEQKERAALGPVSVDTSIAKARKGESVKPLPTETRLLRKITIDINELSNGKGRTGKIWV